MEFLSLSETGVLSLSDWIILIDKYIFVRRVG